MITSEVAETLLDKLIRVGRTLMGASLVSQTVKNLPVMQETQVQSLGWEDPLEKGMATHSSIPAWRTSWTEEPGRLQSMELQRVVPDWVNTTLSCTDEAGSGMLKKLQECAFINLYSVLGALSSW